MHYMTSRFNECGHKWEGDDEPGHSSTDNECVIKILTSNAGQKKYI